jgi:glycosyltransferase involved in cell wall biosynthesis
MKWWRGFGPERMRLGIVTSHPIQYQAPLFRALAKQADIHVYFAHRASADDQAEAGFGGGFDWDTDLTSGYPHSFLRNASTRPGIVRFGGCDSPDVGRTLAADRPDVMVVFGWHFKTYLQAARAARALGIPVMARTDSHLNAPRPLAKRVVKSIGFPLFLRQFDAFLPTGTRSAAYLRHYRVPETRIRVVPCCIDVEAFRSREKEARSRREQIRAGWGAGSGDLIILFVGKLIGLKRIGDLLEAAGLLVQSRHAIRVMIVGTGTLEAQLRRQGQDLKVPVTFVGFVNQSSLAEFYVGADLLVLPSESETWGLVVNEAFACGLPAIVSDKVGCAPDMIRENLTGRVVPTGDSQRLAAAIQEFPRKMHDRAVTQALAKMTETFSPRRSAEAFIAAAEASLGGARARWGWKGWRR